MSSTALRAVRALAILYVAAVLGAGLLHSPTLWGIHAVGFLPRGSALLLGALLIAGVWLLFAQRGETPHAPPSRSRPSPRVPKANLVAPGLPAAGWIIPIALAGGLAMWLLRCRTPFLGDGIRWIAIAEHGGGYLTPSEPFSTTLWKGAGIFLASLSIPVTPSTLGFLSILCGLAALALYWQIAYEVGAASRGAFWASFGILATLGLNQLFCGYIEAYPPAALFGLAYLWLGMRASRGSVGVAIPGVVLGLAMATHLLSLFLIASYAALIWMKRRAPLVRLAQFAIPLCVGTLLMALSGYDLATFAAALHLPTKHAPHFVLLGSGGDPYAAISLAHGIDILNEIFLVLPVPALLIGSALLSPEARESRLTPTTTFLVVAAIPGLLASSSLMLPMPMVIDWDLHSLLLIPTAVLGVWSWRPLLSRPTWGGVRLGLLCIGLASALAFLGVNANEAAGLHRFQAAVGPGAKISRYGANHGSEVLVHYFRDRGDLDAAFREASKLVKREPTNARYMALAGTILYLQRSYERAIPFLTGAVEMQPESLGTRTNLAICLSATGRHGQAMAEFRDVLRRGPDSPAYYLNYAIECAASGSTAVARSTLEEAVRRWPDYQPAALAYRNMLARFPSPAGRPPIPPP